jgi:hypothetical protein
MARSRTRLVFFSESSSILDLDDVFQIVQKLVLDLAEVFQIVQKLVD